LHGRAPKGSGDGQTLPIASEISNSGELRKFEAVNADTPRVIDAKERIMQSKSGWAAPGDSNSILPDQLPYTPLALDPIRILIVADLAASTQISALVHSIGHFKTRIASSADPALNIAHSFLPNLVLMSTDLPDLASYRLASALRWHSGLPSLRLIALTDDIPSTDRGRALAAGFEQYLTLPVQQAALESALAPHLGNHPRWHDLRSARIRPQ
jgi:CheY-like chemotaxis protein